MSESKTPSDWQAQHEQISASMKRSELESGLVTAWKVLTRTASDLAAARAEVERLRKDAERYEFMRDNAHPLEQYDYATKTDNGVSCYHMVDGVRELKSGTELDAAIDAALAAQEPT